LEEFKQLVEDWGNDVYKARIETNPTNTIAIADRREATLIKRIEKQQPNSILLPIYKNGLVRVQYEKTAALREQSFHAKLLDLVGPVALNIEKLAKETENPEHYGLFNYAMGDSYYIVRDFATAIRYLSEAAKYLKNPDDRLAVLRVLGIVTAKLVQRHMMDEKRYDAIIEEMLFIIKNDTDNVERMCETYEGIGRSLGIMLRLDEALEMTETGYKLYIEASQIMTISKIRHYQIARTEGNLLLDFDIRDEEILRRLRELLSDRDDRYPRITEQLIEIINKLKKPIQD